MGSPYGFKFHWAGKFPTQRQSVLLELPRPVERLMSWIRPRAWHQ